MDDLKPCPLCDSTKIKHGQYRQNGYQMLCRGCGLAYRQRTKLYTLDELKARMFESWNTRPGEAAAVAAERERIIQYITTHQQKCYVAHGRTMTGVHVLPLIDAIRARGGE